MELLDPSPDAQSEQSVPAANADNEPKTTISFQKGVDFETFDDFCGLFLSIFKDSELAAGETRIQKLIESDAPSRLLSLPNFAALKITIPESLLDFRKLRTRIHESQRVIEQMGDSWLDPGMLNTTMLQIGWPGGTLTLRCTGVPKISKEADTEITNAMQQFSSECQMMLIWFVGILGSQRAMRAHVNDVAEQGKPFTINTYRPDGRVDSILARVPVDSVVEAFAEAGDFERLYAKSFVVFTYQIWEEVTRPRIAAALKVENPKHVKAELMGDWRHLRNWLVHRNKTTENDYFHKAEILPHALDMQPDDPSLTANGVATLMQQLNHMRVDVNPRSLDFGLELTRTDGSLVAEVAKSVEAGHQVALPEALMYPSGVMIVFNDGPEATIHERDCRYADEHFRGLDGGRVLLLTSRNLARDTLKHLGKAEQKCVHCS
ncbi:MAG: hypothetical protein OXC11_00350 [Rhodospirillales bacterium]|nr:hypothetical protein [Rhodospirillales bacterium]